MLSINANADGGAQPMWRGADISKFHQAKPGQQGVRSSGILIAYGNGRKWQRFARKLVTVRGNLRCMASATNRETFIVDVGNCPFAMPPHKPHSRRVRYVLNSDYVWDRMGIAIGAAAELGRCFTFVSRDPGEHISFAGLDACLCLNRRAGAVDYHLHRGGTRPPHHWC